MNDTTIPILLLIGIMLLNIAVCYGILWLITKIKTKKQVEVP